MPARAGRVELQVTVRIEIAGHQRRQRGRRQRCGRGIAAVFPDTVVQEDVVRRRVLDHDHIGISIVVEIGHRHTARRTAVAGDAGGRANGPEAAAAVVVEQFVRTGSIDEPNVEIAVVIGVEDRAVDDVCARKLETGGGGDVGPATVGCLPPHLRAAGGAAQHHVDEAVIVEIAPQRGPHVSDTSPGNARRRPRTAGLVS